MNSYQTLEELIGIDSPSGYTGEAGKYIYELLSSYGYNPIYTNKKAIRVALGENPKLVIAAHFDTLGAIVSQTKGDGTLEVSALGGWPSCNFEGEYVTVYTLEGKSYSGTFLLNNPSIHTNRDVQKTERHLKNMHIRLDEEVESKKDVMSLGIRVGDIVCFDPRYQELPSGYIKSRFLDNKAGCYALCEIARRLKENKKSYPVELFFSNYEEVGHGAASGFSDGIEEMLVIDMGVIGDNCEGKETCCSICAKDSTGPYDYDFRRDLVFLAEKHDIPFRLAIYHHYGSDGSTALRAGHDFSVALIGPGVAASHAMERTHKKGIKATIDLCFAYMEEKFHE